MEYRRRSIHDLLHSLPVTIIRVASCHSAVHNLNQPLVLVVSINPCSLRCRIAVVVIAVGEVLECACYKRSKAVLGVVGDRACQAVPVGDPAHPAEGLVGDAHSDIGSAVYPMMHPHSGSTSAFCSFLKYIFCPGNIRSGSGILFSPAMWG
jgi:hypothetical protein